MQSYAVPEELEVRLDRSDNGTFQSLLDTATAQVNAYCGRQFNRVGVASTRRFRAHDPERLPVDDFYTLDDLEVEIDGVVWDSSYYEPRPYDGVVNGETGWPFFDLMAVNRSWPIYRRPTISVTARWGWAAVPAGIIEATLDVAEGIASGSNSGIISREEVDNYSVSFARPGAGLTVAPRVPGLLVKADPYRRKRFGFA